MKRKNTRFESIRKSKENLIEKNQLKKKNRLKNDQKT